MTRRELASRIGADELIEWSLYYKLKAEQEKEAQLAARAEAKLESRKRGSLSGNG